MHLCGNDAQPFSQYNPVYFFHMPTQRSLQCSALRLTMLIGFVTVFVCVFRNQAPAEVDMRAACLILLSSLAVCSLRGIQCQNIPSEEDPGERPSLDEILQRAQTLLMRSILKKMEDEENADGGASCMSVLYYRNDLQTERLKEMFEGPSKNVQDEPI